MNEAMKLILSLSLSGSILAIFIFAIKPLIKHKLSKSIQYYIWVVVLLRLVLPFSLEGSIMNTVFYSDKAPVVLSVAGIAQSIDGTSVNTINSAVSSGVQENVAKGVYNFDADHSRYIRDLFIQYALYLWLLGVVVALTVNITGYTRFAKYLKLANKPATPEENRIFAVLLDGRSNVSLVRNPLATTPMLIGILRPMIIIPEIVFEEKQLKNILLHELSHLRRFDIAVKWLTMIAISIHWFNPLMYFIKKEINHACELACDEAVIKNLSSAEKQAYGDTLISVVAEHKYPLGVLQATMCEEKETLKERLVAIMKYNKKSKYIILMSIMLLGAVICSALFLGACSSKTTQEVIYKNDKYGFSVNLPKDFADTVNVKEEANTLFFEYKDKQTMSPDEIVYIVGRIEIYDKNEASRESMKEREDSYNLRYLGENEKYYFGWAHATDVQLPFNAPQKLKDKCSAMERKFDEIIKTVKIASVTISSSNEIVNFANGQVEIAGRKLAYKATDLAPLYKKISSAEVEQMMYRAVAFYEAAFGRDYDTINRLAHEQLKNELQRWADNTLKKEDYSATAIIKLDNYTDVAFPTGISAPVANPAESDKYMVMLELSPDTQVQVSFAVVKDKKPLVTGFSLIMGGKVQK